MEAKHTPGKTIKQRFDERVFYSPDGCWYWTGSKFKAGYGSLLIEGKSKQAHRVSYQLHKGEITNGLFVCHTCDNKICVNPDHLWLGTCLDNVKDMIDKGRQVILRGEQIGNSKLTEKKVRQILIKRAKGISTFKLAKEYKVDITSIQKILRGATWRHIILAKEAITKAEKP